MKFQINESESFKKKLLESNRQNAKIKKELSDIKSKVQVTTVVGNDHIHGQQSSVSTMPPLKSTTLALPSKNRNLSGSYVMDTTIAGSKIIPEIKAENNFQSTKAPIQPLKDNVYSQTHVKIMSRKLPGQMSACKLLFPLLEDLISSINHFRSGPVILPSSSNIYLPNVELGRFKDPTPLSSTIFTPISISKHSMFGNSLISGSFTDKIPTNSVATSHSYMPQIQEIIIKILEIFRYSLDDCYNEKFPVALLSRYLTAISNKLLKHAPTDNSVENMKRDESSLRSSGIESTSIITLYDKFDPIMCAIRFLIGVLNRLDSSTCDIYAQQNSSDSSYKANLDLSKFSEVGMDLNKRKYATLDNDCNTASSNGHPTVEYSASFDSKVLAGFDTPSISNVELRKHYITATGTVPKIIDLRHTEVATNLPEHFLDHFEDLPSIFVDLAQDVLGEIYYSMIHSSGAITGKLKGTTNKLLNETSIFLRYLLLHCNFCKISDFTPLIKTQNSTNSKSIKPSDSMAPRSSVADAYESRLQPMYPFLMSLLTDEICFNSINMQLKTKLLDILALMICKHDSLFDAFAESQVGFIGSTVDEESESESSMLFTDTLVIQGLKIITNFTWFPDNFFDSSPCTDQVGNAIHSLVMYEAVSYLLEIVTFFTLLLESYGGKAVTAFFGIKFDENQMELDGTGTTNVFNIHTCSDQDRNRISKSNFVHNICKIWTLAIKYCDGIRNGTEDGAGYQTKIDQVMIQIVIYSTKILYNVAHSVAEGNWHILSRICNEMLYAQLYRFANRQVPSALSECIDYIESVEDIQILYCS